MIDLKLDFMNRVIFADQNATVRVCDTRFVEVILTNIIGMPATYTGSFGKCIWLSGDKDVAFCVRETFQVSMIDLSHDGFKVKDTFKMEESEENLSDWSVDTKKMIFYFLLKNGVILCYDYKTKKTHTMKIEEKWLKMLFKEERNFTALGLSSDFKFLAISGVVTYKEKKTNNIFLYKIDLDAKRDLKLSFVAQIATENNWEGSRGS